MIKGPRDSRLTRELLLRDGLDGYVCTNMQELCSELDRGAAVALLAEECLTPETVQELAKVLEGQPAWSDFPIVVFSAAGTGVRGSGDALRALGNVIFLDRPIQVRSMLASVHAARRSRHRQYEARHAIESRDAFLAMLGHELRNPLGAIRLAALLLDGKHNEHDAPKELKVIDRQSRHLSRLVDDLLDVARVTHGKVVLHREKLNLVSVAQNAFDALEARARERRLSYDFLAPVTEIFVHGDRHRLEQVFTNLLTNAIKYTPAGGTIRVEARTDGDLAVVAVTDTGVGLAPEMRERVFDTFAQVDHSLERSEGGIGLGLALVRSVVDLHEGTVEAVSSGLGQGSSFIVRLPALSTAHMVEEHESASSAHGPSVKRVVVVEDSEDIRDLLVQLLQTSGHDVLAAENGPEGLEKILTFAPEVAFVDIGLPGFDGFELARRARASGCKARLIAVTGYGQAEDKQRAADSGFDEHMTKPVLNTDIERAMLAAEG
ncbi:MAG TPA: hybrid sensor histidine kinase/response regulator [Polyangiaceae bacterium]